MTVVSSRPEEYASEWPAVRLLAREVDLAFAVSTIWMERRKWVGPSRHDMDDVWRQNYWGAQAKVAFRVLCGLPLDDAQTIANQWREPMAGYLAKGTSRRSCELTIDVRERDDRMYPFVRYALLLKRGAWFAIVGEIDKAAAWERKVWLDRLGTPSWGVRLEDLSGYSGPRAEIAADRGAWTCAHGSYRDGERCFCCEPLRLDLFPPRDKGGKR